MSEPLIPDSFKNICSETFGIRSSHVLDAVKSPNNVEVIKVNGLNLRVYLKHITLTRPPISLVIIERVANETKTIDFALKAYANLTSDIYVKTPLEIIELIAERFGLYIQIGQKRAKFIIHEKIPIDRAQEKIRVAEGANPKNHNFVQQFYCKIEVGPPMVMNCALCYCLDIDDYVSWLKNNKRF